MQFLGFFLDNEKLRSAFHDVKEIAEYVTLKRASINLPSEYKSREGQKLGGISELSALRKMDGIKASVSDLIKIDTARFAQGLSMKALSASSSVRKISDVNNTYINDCIQFTPDYWEQGFKDDAFAMFVTFDHATGSMQVRAISISLPSTSFTPPIVASRIGNRVAQKITKTFEVSPSPISRMKTG